MQKMNDLNSNIQNLMCSKKLPIYQFDNGSKVCNASLYNLYEVLKLLNLIDKKISYEAVCWIRDYLYGYTIETVEQLEKLLLNEKTRLRISFFSYKILDVSDLIIAANNGSLPIINDNSNILKKELHVYTIWFVEGLNQDIPYLNKSNIKNTNTLFEEVTNAYKTLYDTQSNNNILKSSERLHQNFATLKTTSNGHCIEPVLNSTYVKK